MTRMFRAVGMCIVAVTVSVVPIKTVDALQKEVSSPSYSSVERLALLADSPLASNEPTPAKTEPASAPSNEPIPFSLSTMSTDLVPPFPAHPELESRQATSVFEASIEEASEQNVAAESEEPDSIDRQCHELTEMIAGNLDSDISIEARKKMIETALKMVARSVALEAEAEFTRIKADHALEMARIQAQIGQMRSMASAADQINRVAGPLNQMLQKNYEQTMAMNLGNQQLTEALTQLGYRQLEKQIAASQANRRTIQLTSPTPSPQLPDSDSQWQIAQLTQEIAELKQQLQKQNSNGVQPAAYQQPLQPRRQPLEPLPLPQHWRR